MHVRFQVSENLSVAYDATAEPRVGDRVALSMQDRTTFGARDVRGTITARRWQTVRSTAGYGLGSNEMYYPVELVLVCDVEEDAPASEARGGEDA